MRTRRSRLIAITTTIVATVGVVLGPVWLAPINRGTNSMAVSTPTTGSSPPTSLLAPDTLSSASMSLSAAPVAVPLIIQIPKISVESHVLAVGMTAAHAMAAPEGGAASPYWADTFWYRGSALPGASGTATIAGHIDDRYGRYAVFGRLSELARGDLIVIRNTKTHQVERFVVTGTRVFSLAQSRTPKVLDLIYGYGPPHGLAPVPSRDGSAHLSLVTCAGTWDTQLGTHDARLVVSAVRVR